VDTEFLYSIVMRDGGGKKEEGKDPATEPGKMRWAAYRDVSQGEKGGKRKEKGGRPGGDSIGMVFL